MVTRALHACVMSHCVSESVVHWPYTYGSDLGISSTHASSALTKVSPERDFRACKFPADAEIADDEVAEEHGG